MYDATAGLAPWQRRHLCSSPRRGRGGGWWRTRTRSQSRCATEAVVGSCIHTSSSLRPLRTFWVADRPLLWNGVAWHVSLPARPAVLVPTLAACPPPACPRRRTLCTPSWSVWGAAAAPRCTRSWRPTARSSPSSASACRWGSGLGYISWCRGGTRLAQRNVAGGAPLGCTAVLGLVLRCRTTAHVTSPGCCFLCFRLHRLQGRDAEAASGFLDEIKLLNSLAGKSNIIQLIDSEVCSCVLLCEGGR